MPYKVFFITAAFSALLLSGACTPVKENRGNFLREEKLSQVTPTITTKSEITRNFGPPTTVAAFDPNTWYYIGERTETMGMFETEVVERRIVQVRFDENDVLQDIQELDDTQARNINFAEETTPTAGKDFTIIQQLVGNVGRFNPQQGRANTGGGVNR